MEKSDLLLPFALFYKRINSVGRKLYGRGIFKSYDLGAPTISVGNITFGGTGKTPMVAFVAEVLAENGEKVCILTRGYKRENERERVVVSDDNQIISNAKQAGDEPIELARKLLGKALVIADANRVEAGKWALNNSSATVFVLDDAFQHFKVKRDLDIVCIDATNPFGSNNTIRAGILREPLKNMSYADLFVITRANLIDEKQLENLKTEISKYNKKAEIFVSQNKIELIKDLKAFNSQDKTLTSSEDNERLTNEKSFAFCALGNPENFFRQLQSEGFNLTGSTSFPDHFPYTQRDIDEIETLASENSAERLLITAKDAVKMQNLKFKMPCFVVESKMIFNDEESLKKLILQSVLFRRKIGDFETK